MIPRSNYPDTFYRVSLKAIIRNSRGEVLVVKEKSEAWSLPGGGWSNGESVHEALQRELYEEVLIDSPFVERLVATESMFVEEKQAWLLWLVYEIECQEYTYGIGPDAQEVRFIDPRTLQNSSFRAERLVYKFAHQRQFE